MTSSIITMLMLEDNDDDWLLTKRSIEDEKLAINLFRVRNGEEGLAVLHGEDGQLDTLDGPAPYSDLRRPDLILCDLYMPRMDGKGFLSIVKHDPDREIRRIPIVVLTTSRDEVDMAASYDLGAAAYIVKPLTVGEMSTVVRHIHDFFLTVVSLPGHLHSYQQ